MTGLQEVAGTGAQTASEIPGNHVNTGIVNITLGARTSSPPSFVVKLKQERNGRLEEPLTVNKVLLAERMKLPLKQFNTGL